jgi:hypothetical protein
VEIMPPAAQNMDESSSVPSWISASGAGFISLV